MVVWLVSALLPFAALLVQVSFLEAVIDLDGDRLITAEEILEAFKQVSAPVCACVCVRVCAHAGSGHEACTVTCTRVSVRKCMSVCVCLRACAHSLRRSVPV